MGHVIAVTNYHCLNTGQTNHHYSYSRTIKEYFRAFDGLCSIFKLIISLCLFNYIIKHILNIF